MPRLRTALASASLLTLFAGLLPVGAPTAVAATPTAPAVDDARSIERLYRSGATAPAMARLDKAIAERPGDAPLRFLKGVLLAEAGRDDEAIAVFQALSEAFPELPEPYNNLAVLQAAKGRIDTARELLETALRHDPAYRAAHENLGDVFVRLAERAYQRAADPAREDAALARKLQLVRQLAAAPR